MSEHKNKPFSKAIQLLQWKDPVEDVAIVFSEGACDIYFFVGDSELIGKLSFDRTWACRSVRTEAAPHMDLESTFSSKIQEVFNSTWPAEIAFGFYTEQSKARLYNNARHFLIKGHDIYHEVLCLGYREAYLSLNDDDYLFAKSVLSSKS